MKKKKYKKKVVLQQKKKIKNCTHDVDVISVVVARREKSYDLQNHALIITTDVGFVVGVVPNSVFC